MNFKRRDTTYVKAELFSGDYESFRKIRDMGIEGTYDETSKIAYWKTSNGTVSCYEGQFVTLTEFGGVAVFNQESFLKHFIAI